MTVAIYVFTAIVFLFAMFTFHEAMESSEDSFIFGALTILCMFIVLFGPTMETRNRVEARWAEHIACEPGVTEINHAVVTDCDAYYNAPVEN